jgi:hypothetical protein
MQQDVRVLSSKEGPADNDVVMVNLPLVAARAPRQVEARQWWIALKEMLRKRALVAGKVAALLLCWSALLDFINVIARAARCHGELDG